MGTLGAKRSLEEQFAEYAQYLHPNRIDQYEKAEQHDLIEMCSRRHRTIAVDEFGHALVHKSISYPDVIQILSSLRHPDMVQWDEDAIDCWRLQFAPLLQQHSSKLSAADMNAAARIEQIAKEHSSVPNVQMLSTQSDALEAQTVLCQEVGHDSKLRTLFEFAQVKASLEYDGVPLFHVSKALMLIKSLQGRNMLMHRHHKAAVVGDAPHEWAYYKAHQVVCKSSSSEPGSLHILNNSPC